MNIKLESQRGETVYTAGAAFEAEPPEIMLWNGQVFRFLRTDGVWDHKKHVYREASVHDLGCDLGHDMGAAAAPELDATPAEEATLTGKKSQNDRQKSDRQISATLTAAQAALLKRVRASGAHASTKATLLAGLEALEKQHTLSNDALLKLLAERLEETRTEGKQR